MEHQKNKLNEKETEKLAKLFEINGYKTDLTEEQQERVDAIAEEGFEFAKSVLDQTQQSPDQSAAVRQIREATWTAIAAVKAENYGAGKEQEKAGSAA